MFFVHTINCSSSINILFRKKYQHYNQFLRHFQRDLLLHLRPNLLYFLLGFLVGFTTPSAFASSFEAALGPAVRYEEPTFFFFFRNKIWERYNICVSDLQPGAGPGRGNDSAGRPSHNQFPSLRIHHTGSYQRRSSFKLELIWNWSLWQTNSQMWAQAKYQICRHYFCCWRK